MDLRLTSVEIAMNGTRLLGPVELYIATTGITIILGPNGSGKSLFLGAAHGLLTPSKGTVTWGGRTATATRADRSYVFQNPPVLRRSVAENIAFPLTARGIKGPARAEALARALSDARLTHDATKPAATLSGGERQRMALARAMITKPNAILMDEPAANLDPSATKELEDTVRQISASGTNVLMATHDLGQARRLADNVLFFDRGLLTEMTDTASFFAGPTSEAARKFLEGHL